MSRYIQLLKPLLFILNNGGLKMTSKEALEKICLHCEHYHQDMCFRAITGCEEWHKLEKDLECLEQIDNAKPSEALQCVNVLKEDDCITTLTQGKALEIIRQALLKAQEQDKILEIIKKWSFLDTFYREDTDTTYDRFLCNIHTKGMKEDFEKIKEWLKL